MPRFYPLLAAAACAALLVAAGPAAASGWYVGGGAGRTKADFTRSDFSPFLESGSYRADDSDSGLRLFGGYRVAPHAAVEFGLSSLGKYRHRFDAPSGVAIYDYEASALTVAIAGNLPLGAGISLNGRAGLAFTAANLRLRVDNGTAKVPDCNDTWWYSGCTSTSTNVYWGAGAQLDFTPHFGMRLDYDNYGEVGQEFETGRAKIDVWSLNFLYNF